MSINVPSSVKRRQILQLITAAGLAYSSAGLARGVLDRPLTLICPFGAGGTADQYLRTLGRVAESILQQPVIVENKPGGGGSLAAGYITRAKPDGHTLLFMPSGAYRAPWIQEGIKFDPTKDFTYVIGLTSLEFCLCVRSDSEIKTLEDFISVGKEKPGSLQYAAGSPVTLAPITLASFQKEYGVEYQHIPYNSGTEITSALLGGHVDALIDSVGANVPYINNGEFRLVAALGEERLAPWPDIPTAVEQGYPLVLQGPMGLVGPRGLEPSLVQQLHDVFHEAMKAPEVEKLLALIAQPSWYRNPEEYTEYGKHAFEESGRLLRAAGLAIK